jgi:hypothetical protein
MQTGIAQNFLTVNLALTARTCFEGWDRIGSRRHTENRRAK